MKKIVFLFLFIVLLTGCAQEEIKEGEVYVVKVDHYSEESLGDLLNVEGRMPFQKYVNQSFIDESNANRILLTIDPNGKEMYWMERIEIDGFMPVVKGETREKVRISKEDIATGEQKIVIKEIPFVSKVLWNAKGNLVAFGGGERLTIYDAENKSTIMKEKLQEDTITNFFWSPTDENKLYSEQTNLANGSIYYLTSQKKVEAYETREETYYKGKLDSNYYYGTKWDLVNGEIKTVILDKQGKIIKGLTPGRFRDAYQKSLVVVGEGEFGLYYIKDINRSQEVITLTEEHVYDVKFITDGKIAYTTKTKDIEENSFYLNIVSDTGRQLKKMKVYGDSIAVLPDGKAGYISGPHWQLVDFIQNNKVNSSTVEGEETNDLQEIYPVIRGAMTTLYDFELKGQQNRNKIKKYFKNTHAPEQWAYFDIEKMFEERPASKPTGDYVISIELKSYDMTLSGDEASITIGVNTKNSYGRSVDMEYALELIKKEGSWYITGFSTFPYSPEYKEISIIVEETIASIQKGKLFSGELKDKEISIGQIQFWISGMSQLAPSVENANAAKVFLKVSNQDKEEIYKLVLEKMNESYWEPTKLSGEDLSSL
ncbi:MAG: membrane lipoprotein lipid attachment site-containing protein [Clostridiaceae bacterium]|nr:membrane lipoprotein lipid attachment site-containing protein [Clostridiaceae bacterium]